MKHIRAFTIIVAIIVLVGIISVLQSSVDTTEEEPPAVLNADALEARIGDAPTFFLEISETPEERTRGLSDHTQLASQEGMLFVFPEEATHGFWMKDMDFAIDILWFNSAQELVHIEEAVNPESFPTIFRPDSPAQYVVELSAGTVEDHGIALGDLLSVDSDALE